MHATPAETTCIRPDAVVLIAKQDANRGFSKQQLILIAECQIICFVATMATLREGRDLLCTCNEYFLDLAVQNTCSKTLVTCHGSMQLLCFCIPTSKSDAMIHASCGHYTGSCAPKAGHFEVNMQLTCCCLASGVGQSLYTHQQVV